MKIYIINRDRGWASEYFYVKVSKKEIIGFMKNLKKKGKRGYHYRYTEYTKPKIITTKLVMKKLEND